MVIPNVSSISTHHSRSELAVATSTGCILFASNVQGEGPTPELVHPTISCSLAVDHNPFHVRNQEEEKKKLWVPLKGKWMVHWPHRPQWLREGQDDDR
eukprot:m.134804 g.134804  ORF g.134804 m.134804 type:complete len:98 (-) comp22548_c1_seq2:3447-3740(-)